MSEQSTFIEVSVEAFFDTVFPKHSSIRSTLYDSVELDTSLLKGHALEVDTYPSLIEFINNVGSGTKKYQCMDVADWADFALGKDTRRADLSIFKSDPASKKFWCDPKFEPGDKCSEARRPHTARNCVSQAVCGGEVKMKSDKNGFGMTGKEPFLPESQKAQQTRAQICGYAADILNHQQRTFVLMFYVYRTHARLLLVDRGAVLVSQPIDLEKNWAMFAKFFHCLKTAPVAGLGYDPTANMLPKDPGSNADYKALQEALT
ncbi:hypothetical protein EIP91_007870, partial [Steccherinum ochraceum]